MFRVVLTSLLLLFSMQTWAEKLVVYSGRGEALVGPLLERFTQETGIELDVRYNNSPAITTQLLTEQEDTPADVVFLQDPGYLSVLGEAKLLTKLDDDLLQQVDERFRDDTGYWIGTSGRARVLVYNANKLKPEDLPKTLEELPSSKWTGRIGWAPSNGSAQAHMSAMLEVWGKEKFVDWLKQMKALKPVAYTRNSAIVEAVHNGEIDLGWVNHYYALRLAEHNPQFAAVNYRFPVDGDIGNVLMTAGAGILKSSSQKELARTFIEYLLSPSAQQYFAEVGFEYPTRPGIPTHPKVIPLADMGFAKVNENVLADVQDVVVLLQELGIL